MPDLLHVRAIPPSAVGGKGFVPGRAYQQQRRPKQQEAGQEVGKVNRKREAKPNIPVMRTVRRPIRSDSFPQKGAKKNCIKAKRPVIIPT